MVEKYKNDTNASEFYQALDRRMWITKCSRFNAAKRLNSKYNWSLASISILSVYGVSIPIIQSTIDLSSCKEINEAYSILATILSIFILTVSLLEGAKNYQVRAERLHNNALEISHLCRELEYLKYAEMHADSFLKKIYDISTRYEKSLSGNSENHEQSDYELLRVQYPDYFKASPAKALLTKLFLFIRGYWLYSISVATFPVFVLSLFLSCR